MTDPKVLLVDIETAPILAYVWQIWDVNIPLNMIKSDWHLLSWSAKWLGKDEILYADQRKAKFINDDRKILEKLWKLLDEADLVVAQNGKKFDKKKIFARFIINGMNPPKDFRMIDTYQIAKQKFGFTSNKLEHLSKILDLEIKKDQHKDFPGFTLWEQCLARNPKAWVEMEKYNKLDVLSLEKLYTKLSPWDASVNFTIFNGKCSCGSSEFVKKGFRYTDSAKYQRMVCKKCGKSYRDKVNFNKTNQLRK